MIQKIGDHSCIFPLDLPARGTCTFAGVDQERREGYGAPTNHRPARSRHRRPGEDHSLLRAGRYIASATPHYRRVPTVCAGRYASTPVHSPGAGPGAVSAQHPNVDGCARQWAAAQYASTAATPTDRAPGHRAPADCRLPAPRATARTGVATAADHVLLGGCRGLPVSGEPGDADGAVDIPAATNSHNGRSKYESTRYYGVLDTARHDKRWQLRLRLRLWLWRRIIPDPPGAAAARRRISRGGGT